MAKYSVSDLTSLAKHHFSKQWPVTTLWQTIADHFYPERADFTITRNVGTELSDLLVDSYPLLVRRDLGNSLSAMLRDGEWFKNTVMDTDAKGKEWLDWSTDRLRKLMYYRNANFVNATKQGDHDWATFGQCVISVEVNRKATGLLYRCWHLRDVCWWDDENGQIGGVIRKWKPTNHDLYQVFGDKCYKDVCDQHRGPKAFKQVEIRHFVIDSSLYGDPAFERFPFVSVFLDVTHGHIIEETGLNQMMYVIPRFQTIAGSQYAYSPATTVGLPDARSLQAMTHTLLEAGERYTRPPIVATQKVIRGDVDLSPDGITWLDKEYDERLGAALRPLSQDRGGYPIGHQFRDGVYEILASAFYLNKITLPPIGTDMTAYEVAERMKQYRRENLPLFSPVESDYNGQLCEVSMSLAMNAGFMGSPYDIPESLRRKEIEFKFQSPLSEGEEEKKATQFGQVAQLLGQAAQYDEGVIKNVNFDTAIRDAIRGLGTPNRWLTDLRSVMEKRAVSEQQEEMMKGTEMANQMAGAQMNLDAAGAG